MNRTEYKPAIQVQSNLSTTATLGTGESRLYRSGCYGEGHRGFFLGGGGEGVHYVYFSICKSIHQNINRNRDQQRPVRRSLMIFHSKKTGFCITVCQSLINWPLSRGYVGS